MSVHPDWESHMEEESTVFLRFDPNWLRYSDYSQEPAEILVLGSF